MPQKKRRQPADMPKPDDRPDLLRRAADDAEAAGWDTRTVAMIRQAETDERADQAARNGPGLGGIQFQAPSGGMQRFEPTPAPTAQITGQYGAITQDTLGRPDTAGAFGRAAASPFAEIPEVPSPYMEQPDPVLVAALKGIGVNYEAAGAGPGPVGERGLAGPAGAPPAAGQAPAGAQPAVVPGQQPLVAPDPAAQQQALKAVSNDQFLAINEGLQSLATGKDPNKPVLLEDRINELETTYGRGIWGRYYGPDKYFATNIGRRRDAGMSARDISRDLAGLTAAEEADLPEKQLARLDVDLGAVRQGEGGDAARAALFNQAELADPEGTHFGPNMRKLARRKKAGLPNWARLEPKEKKEEEGLSRADTEAHLKKIDRIFTGTFKRGKIPGVIGAGEIGAGEVEMISGEVTVDPGALPRGLGTQRQIRTAYGLTGAKTAPGVAELLYLGPKAYYKKHGGQAPANAPEFSGLREAYKQMQEHFTAAHNLSEEQIRRLWTAYLADKDMAKWAWRRMDKKAKEEAANRATPAGEEPTSASAEEGVTEPTPAAGPAEVVIPPGAPPMPTRAPDKREGDAQIWADESGWETYVEPGGTTWFPPAGSNDAYHLTNDGQKQYRPEGSQDWQEGWPEDTQARSGEVTELARLIQDKAPKKQWWAQYLALPAAQQRQLEEWAENAGHFKKRGRK